MRPKTILTGALLGITGFFAFAQQPDYFPLDPGNIWVYRCTGACSESTVTVQIGSTQDFNGTTYSRLQDWFGAAYWVREDSDGNVFAYDPTSDQEQLWYAFGSPPGAVYDESIPACCGKAKIASTSAHYEGPVGVFDNALEIDYPGVFQVGIYREVFLAYVGLVSRSQAVGGPAIRTYDLIYSRIGGVTIVSQPEFSTGLALDRAVYLASDSPTLSVRLSIRNSTSDPVTLTFPTGQIYDLEIRDDQGNVAFLWSMGKAFPQIVTTFEIQYEKDYVIAAPLAGLPPGKYVAQGWFAVAGPRRAYSASARFEIK
ncbi:MAG TPA: BsuPI-related putative proteinase inhibitor [Bryobacteraceae bacterium]|nr:BsuPI-related putative proteinase inhibitor [Bryobacteraceae bacterium]